MEDGELLLVDAGAEWECFSGDITRTFPVNGRFSREQADVYQVVLDAQLAAIDQVRPGNSFQAVHDTAVRALADGLIRLGLIEGPLETAIEKETYKPFYMHKTSHWLGLDVHDVGRYRVRGEWRTLAPGMVLTVEPGLYVGEQVPSAGERYRNIGVRIEDDVLVTEAGHEVLTAGVPKTIREVEREIARGR
jgi:Xaa-Pro aminopeptidase